MSEARVTLVRRVSFSSGHRYWLETLSAEENRALFGKWASPYNHGHNYVLWVYASGLADPQTGMVVNIKRIDDVLQERVVNVFDLKSINDEVPAFAGLVPSTENLLLHFAGLLHHLPEQATLTGLKLEETPLLYGEWNPKNMISLTRTYEFAAAHRLHVPDFAPDENLRLFGKCNNAHGHGHNYVLEVTVTGDPDPVSGMICDLGVLDAVVGAEVVSRYDHKHLNLDMPEFSGRNATSEVVALEIFDRLKRKTPARLSRVRLYETARNMFEVVDDGR